MNKETIRTLVVATVLCVVCSVLVSSAAVFLKPAQDANKKLDVRKNLLLASGLLTNSSATKKEIEEAFKVVETKVIDLQTGDFVDMDPESFNADKASKNLETGILIDASKDRAGIKRRAKNAKVYLIKQDGKLSMIVLPVHGKGLWSTLYGFMAVDTDYNTVRGLGFYQHGETPGLGGEIENPRWKKQWIGKKIYGDDLTSPELKVIKGSVNPSSEKASYQIDGLSGATLTSNGVSGMVAYWFGMDGYGPFLQKMRSQGVAQ